LRAGPVRAPITTNMMVTWYGYDHEAMGRELDVIAGDYYGLRRRPMFGSPFASEAFAHAYLRGIRHGRPSWFLEFQPSGALPGRYRWEALTQVGLGTQLIDYFRFDTCASGNERGGGMVGVHRRPGWDYEEIRQVAADLRTARPAIEGSTRLAAKVAVLYTFANHCEYARYPKFAEFEGRFGNGYAIHLSRHFQAVAEQNIACDIVYPGADFSAYDVILAPALYILPRDLAARLEGFVRAGGTLLLSSFSGVADEYAKIWDVPIPGPLGDVFGIEVRNSVAAPAQHGPFRIVPGAGAADMPPLTQVAWFDAVLPRTDDVEVLARADSPLYPETAVVTRRPYGQGWVYYLGAILDDEGYRAFYGALAPRLELKPTMPLPPGVFASVRVKGDQRIVFLNNPHAQSCSVELPDRYVDLFTGDTAEGRITLAPFTVRVLTPPR
jgi:beta-galactosidase